MGNDVQPSDRKRVLVVDDNVDAAELLGMALEHEGAEVLIAHASNDALDIAARLVPDLAVLDIGLPVMDGYELARRLREAHGDKLKLIALTGHGLESDRARARDAGFDLHLLKPVDLKRLRAAIQELTT